MAIFVDSPINVEIVDNDATEIHVLVQSICGTYKRYFGPFSTAGEAAEAADAIVRGIKHVGGVMSGPSPSRREPDLHKIRSRM
jgi:hypothetical protein